MKNCIVSALLAACACLVLGCGGTSSAPPIVLGHIATLSGPDRQAGEQATRGIRLALDELNKDVGQRPIMVRHADTQGQIEAFESQAVRMAALNRVAGILGGTTPEEVLRLDRARVPGVPGEPPPLFLPIVSPCGWWQPALSDQVFLLGMMPSAQGQVLARFAAENLDVTTLVIAVNDQHDPYRALAEAAARAFTEAVQKRFPKAEGLGVKVLHFDPGQSATAPGESGSLAELVARLEQENPRALLLAGSRQDFQQLRAKLKQPLPILLFGGEEDTLRPGDLDRGDIVYRASAFAIPGTALKDNGLRKALATFVQRFRELFKAEPDVHAALAYEGTWLVADTMRRHADLARLREELRKIKDFPGLAGPLTLVTHQQCQRPLFVLRMDRSHTTLERKFEP